MPKRLAGSDRLRTGPFSAVQQARPDLDEGLGLRLPAQRDRALAAEGVQELGVRAGMTRDPGTAVAAASETLGLRS